MMFLWMARILLLMVIFGIGIIHEKKTVFGRTTKIHSDSIPLECYYSKIWSMLHLGDGNNTKVCYSEFKASTQHKWCPGVHMTEGRCYLGTECGEDCPSGDCGQNKCKTELLTNAYEPLRCEVTICKRQNQAETYYYRNHACKKDPDGVEPYSYYGPHFKIFKKMPIFKQFGRQHCMHASCNTTKCNSDEWVKRVVAERSWKVEDKSITEDFYCFYSNGYWIDPYYKNISKRVRTIIKSDNKTCITLVCPHGKAKNEFKQYAHDHSSRCKKDEKHYNGEARNDSRGVCLCQSCYEPLCNTVKHAIGIDPWNFGTQGFGRFRLPSKKQGLFMN